MARKTILILFFCLFYFHSIVHSSPVINTEDHPPSLVGMQQLIPDHQVSSAELKRLVKEEQHLTRFENRLERIKNAVLQRSAHKLGGFNDPVDRWFWIWIGAWGLGLILTLILGGSATSATLGIIWLSAFALGSVALILWLVRKYR